VATELCADARASVLIKNLGTVTVDLGTSAVTAGTGFPLAAGESVTLEFRDETEDVYAITSATPVTCVLAVLRVVIP
jgi:hypothetical protein